MRNPSTVLWGKSGFNLPPSSCIRRREEEGRGLARSVEPIIHQPTAARTPKLTTNPPQKHQAVKSTYNAASITPLRKKNKIKRKTHKRVRLEVCSFRLAVERRTNDSASADHGFSSAQFGASRSLLLVFTVSPHGRRGLLLASRSPLVELGRPRIKSIAAAMRDKKR